MCTSTVSGDYTPPVSHRFYLTSGADTPYTLREGQPATLNVAASWSLYPDGLTKTSDIPGLGPVTRIGQYAPAGARSTVVVLTSPGRNSPEPRYFAVVVASQGSTAAFEILPQPLADEPGSASTREIPSAPETPSYVIPALVNPAEKFADDANPSFQVQALGTLSNVSLWQVTAKQGIAHEIVWLAAGLNRSTGRFVFSAVRIASEFGKYAGCGKGRSDPFAASIDRKKGTLDAVLDVEPAHEYDLEGKRVDSGDQGQPITPCPRKVKIGWNASSGFVRDESETACPDATRARQMSISDAGVVTVKTEDAGSGH